MNTIALDFDGVLCDSVLELGLSGYRGASIARSHTLLKTPSDEFIQRFKELRPVIETGYESIILSELILRDAHLTGMGNQFRGFRQKIMDEYGLNQNEMITLFGNIRDHWIRDDFSGWLESHSFYPGVLNTLSAIIKAGFQFFIITTKEKRFAFQILQSQKIKIPETNIFGLKDGKKTKILHNLIKKSGSKKGRICFIEDRLKTLESVCCDRRLNSLNLLLATWGYNTALQIKKAKKNSRIRLLTLENFTTPELNDLKTYLFDN